MPYRPGRVSSDDRTRYFTTLWIGLPASLLNVCWLIFAPQDTMAPNLFGVFAAASIGFLPFAYSHDEFIQAHLWTASRWALGAAGLLMMLGVFPVLRTLELLAAIDVTLGLSLVALVFHVALAASRWRGGANP